MEQKVSLLNEAVNRDPKFVLAYCALAKAYDTLPSQRHHAGGKAKHRLPRAG
jgi:hypothetical protein